MGILRAADYIIHTGDFTAESILTELEALAPVAAVHGNMDEPSLRARLPARVVVEMEGVRIGIVHDAGPSVGRYERLLRAFPRCDLVAYGHSHAPELTRVGGAWIVNPGSPTERRRAPEHTLAVVDAAEPRLVRLP